MQKQSPVKPTMRFLRISLAALFVLSGFLLLGELYLRNFSFYGIEHFIQFDESELKQINGNKIDFMPRDLLDLLILQKEESRSRSFRKEKGLYRIVVLGDSIAAGGCVKSPKLDLSFPRVLEGILRNDYPGIDFNILTCAAGGWSTTQEVLAYEQYCKFLNPDLVILAYCHNDTAEAWGRVIDRNGDKLVAFYKTCIPYLSAIPFNFFLTERFLMARLINESLIRFAVHLRISPRVGYCLLGDKKIYSAFRRLHSSAKETDTPVAVAVFPFLEDTPVPGMERMSGLIRGWCEELNFLHIDILEEYGKYDYKQLRQRIDDFIHPNVLGHRLAAEGIAEKLRENKSFVNLTN